VSETNDHVAYGNGTNGCQDGNHRLPACAKELLDVSLDADVDGQGGGVNVGAKADGDAGGLGGLVGSPTGLVGGLL
jgi:hypothetical protein